MALAWLAFQLVSLLPSSYSISNNCGDNSDENILLSISRSEYQGPTCSNAVVCGDSVPAQQYSTYLSYGDRLVIAQTADQGANQCGTYGCRVGFMESICIETSEPHPPVFKRQMLIDVQAKSTMAEGPNNHPPGDSWLGLYFTHGDNCAASQMGLRVRPEPGTVTDGCVKYGDKIILAFTGDSGHSENCGWYGCRVAYMDDTTTFLAFDHGGDTPEAFYLRPPANSGRTGCVNFGDDVVIAQTPDTGNNQITGCGWYGCRVAYMSSDQRMKFTHGGSDPQKFYIRQEPE